MIGNDADLEPWGGTDGLTEAQTLWRERERRQRSVRFLMMFLLMLLLMDGEEQSQRRRSHDNNLHLRKKSKSSKDQPLEKALYQARREQDKILEQMSKNHPRYMSLVQKNQGKDFDFEVRTWAEQQQDLEKDEFAQDEVEHIDPEDEKKVLHYPWNTTGFYRGEWARENFEEEKETESNSDATANIKTANEKVAPTFMSAVELEGPMLDILKQKKEPLGVYLLPTGTELKMPNASLSSETDDFQSNSKSRSHQSAFLRGGTQTQDHQTENPHITLTKASGRAAFQLYSRSVPAIKELSILDGFLKLYDSQSIGYSTRRDILLRVSGVMLHSLGKISLVSNTSPGRSALVISKPLDTYQRRRRLQEALASDLSDSKIEQIRDDALALFLPQGGSDEDPENTVYQSIFIPDESEKAQPMRRLSTLATSEKSLNDDPDSEELETPIEHQTASNTGNEMSRAKAELLQSKYVIPYPFVADDETQSIQNTRTPAARAMPPREQLLEANAGTCEFEINMNIQEKEWTIGQWRALLGRHVKETMRLDPATRDKERDGEGDKTNTHDKSKKAGIKSSAGSKARRPIQDQALVMTINGTIHSPNCDFTANLNATAIRTDWEHTTGKAINYSFYMMLTCLTQIVLLLRQLLHSQTQSAATRVSLMCIGWQTVLDALLCLAHIYLSLAMQPLFTAFASVAFFKLLIFCVIEMKYMAIIIQARNASNGGNTIERLRRQIAMLHLRFYVALIGSFLAFFYAWESYRTLYMLLLYSFWVPQIVNNVVTEAKRPLHPYYIHGMSLTRMVAPLYIFAVQNNFLKEVYPDSPTNVYMCELLVVWVGIQTAVLEAQGRYGARFMIPARFLPPKFDYSRPIPPSLLPPGSLNMTPSENLQNERGLQTEVRALLPRDSSPHNITTGGARNRIRGSKVNRTESSMTTETVAAPPNPALPSFDCVICYNDIDVRNRRGYMLAPCDHLFHRDCLVQWMEVKMECPICRTELPAL